MKLRVSQGLKPVGRNEGERVYFDLIKLVQCSGISAEPKVRLRNVWKLTVVIQWQHEPVLTWKKWSSREVFIYYWSLRGRDRDQVVSERMAEG